MSLQDSGVHSHVDSESLKPIPLTRQDQQQPLSVKSISVLHEMNTNTHLHK